MRTARYGRIRFGRCMREDHGSVGCAADVLSHLDRKCSGRRSCRMMIPDATLHGIHPCPKELMPYLEASYLCVRGNLRPPAPRHYNETFEVKDQFTLFFLFLDAAELSFLSFLPRCMECKRGLAMRILSVRLSVCPSHA